MILQGTRASNGEHTGPVIVLKDPVQISDLVAGCVMVVADTDPDWMPAFEFLAQNGGAIVTEIGGRTCHAAVVSRELRIPCVVGLEGAISKLKGKTIKVDGKTGTVIVL